MRGSTWSPMIDYLSPAKAPEALTNVLPLLHRIVAAYDQATTAGLLGVDKSTVHHWMTGKRNLSPIMAGRVLEVHDILSAAHRVFNPSIAGRWLMGHEPLLGGARPIDVLATRGAAPVIAALDAIAAGGFA